MAYTLLGKNFTPPDIHAKVTGAAKYSEDFRADGMVFLKTFPSPMPHARVKSIDVEAVKKMPGVVGVLLPGELKQPKDAGHAILTSYPVFVGQPILAVAAETEQQAEDAIQAVKVDLEPLPFVTDPLESLRPDGPNALVGGNVANRRGVKLQQIKWSGKDFAKAGDDTLPMGKAATVWSFGDFEAGFAKSKVVVEESFVSAANAHHAMEPRSAAAYWANGKCHVWGSTQSSSFAVPSLAKMIGIKPTDVNLVSEYCGGGFGGKAYSYPLMALPALMSKKLKGRPVLMRISRAEEFINGSARAAFQGWVKIGFGADGKVLALDSYIVQDNGSTGGFWDFQNFGMASSVILQPAAMRFQGIPVLTNTPPKGAQRGPGENQTANILEPILDRAARELGIDRLALRLANAPGGGPNGKIGPKRTPLTSAFLKEGLEQAAAKWGYAEKVKKAGKQANGKIRSVGIGQRPRPAGGPRTDDRRGCGQVRPLPEALPLVGRGGGPGPGGQRRNHARQDRYANLAPRSVDPVGRGLGGGLCLSRCGVAGADLLHRPARLFRLPARASAAAGSDGARPRNLEVRLRAGERRMSEYTRGHIERIEEAYEFMLAYAAQGRTDEGDGPDGAHIRTFLAQFEAGVTAIAGELDTLPGATGEAAAFLDALRADSAIVTSVIRAMLARGQITSEVVDNANGLISVRSYLTGLFFLDKALLP